MQAYNNAFNIETDLIVSVMCGHWQHMVYNKYKSWGEKNIFLYNLCINIIL